MGLRSWIKRHTGHGGRKPSAEAPIAVTAATADTGQRRPIATETVWEPLPAFSPVRTRASMNTCACTASAIAAGDTPSSEIFA